jgi:hypothetical protein
MDKKVKTQQQLKAEGWKIASVSRGDHLKRTLEMYRELGVEVYLEEVRPGQCEDCTQCFEDNKETIYRIYTRTLSA